MPVEVVYFPVKSEARYGAQTGCPDTALSIITDSFENASMFGVNAFSSPLYPSDEYLS